MSRGWRRLCQKQVLLLWDYMVCFCWRVLSIEQARRQASKQWPTPLWSKSREFFCPRMKLINFGSEKGLCFRQFFFLIQSVPLTQSESTRLLWKGNYHCTDGLQLDWILPNMKIYCCYLCVVNLPTESKPFKLETSRTWQIHIF